VASFLRLDALVRSMQVRCTFSDYTFKSCKVIGVIMFFSKMLTMGIVIAWLHILKSTGNVAIFSCPCSFCYCGKFSFFKLANVKWD